MSQLRKGVGVKLHWRVALALTAAFLFGAVVGVLKGQGAGLADALGNLSTPWLLVPLFAGSLLNARQGAILGTIATMLALSGFYFAVAATSDYGLSGVRAGLGLAFHANARYFLAGLVSGPLFGMLGGWWRRRNSVRASLLVGLLLVGEPLVIAVAGSIRVLSRYSGSSQPALRVGELLVGVAVIAWALIRQARHQRRAPAEQ
jgi:Family of unknown function (DUF6518)